MQNIDLTLQGEFHDNRSLKYDTEVAYLDVMGYKDQRRAKSAILGVDSTFSFFNFHIETNEHLEFFGDKENKGWEELQYHEKIYDILGIMTETLHQEYDSGYGSENVCDCCGGFNSNILNMTLSHLCDKCSRYDKYNNKHFWEPESLTTDNWID